MCFVKVFFWIFCAFAKTVFNLKKKYFNLKISKFIFLLLFFISSVIFYYFETSSMNSVRILKEEQWSASCHNLEDGNALELIENLEFAPNFDTIFFIETSCRGGLTSRQACSIEAAARAHPRRTIYVLFLAPVSSYKLQSKIPARLLLFYNVKFARVYFRNYARNTPLEAMIASTPFFDSKWWIEHSSDIIRYLTLYKYGGIYLDTDTLVIKSLVPLGYNWIGRQDDESVNGAAFSLSLDQLGQKTAKALVNELKNSYKYDIFTYNGPEAITRVLQRFCNTYNVTEWSSNTCKGFKVYDVEYFYPIYYTDVHLYFNSSQIAINFRDAYAHHFWNKISHKMKIEKGSPYMKLAEEYCPSIFQIFGEDFGT